MIWRAESSSKAPKREIRFLPALMSIHTQVWKAVFGKPADAIEKSVENADECASHLCVSPTQKSIQLTIDMIIDNDPPIERHISVPRDMSQLSCSSFTAGIVEAVMDGLGFVCTKFYSPLHPTHVIQARSRDGPQHTDGTIPLSNDDTHKTREICTRSRRAFEITSLLSVSAIGVWGPRSVPRTLVRQPRSSLH